MSYDLHNYDEWDFNFSLLSWQTLSLAIGFDEEDSHDKEQKGACDLHWVRWWGYIPKQELSPIEWAWQQFLFQLNHR